MVGILRRDRGWRDSVLSTLPMPLVGIGILAQGIAEFGVLFFNRLTHGKEWEMAIASTYPDHILLVGLGHPGFRVARNLNQLGQDVVVIAVLGGPGEINLFMQENRPSL